MLLMVMQSGRQILYLRDNLLRKFPVIGFRRRGEAQARIQFRVNEIEKLPIRFCAQQ